MYVENVQHASLRYRQVGAQASTLLSSRTRQQIIAASQWRNAREDCVPIRRAGFKLSIFAQAAKVAGFAGLQISIQFALQISGLIVRRRSRGWQQNFLQCDYVRINFQQNFCNPLRTNPAVEPAAFMDVISRNPQRIAFAHPAMLLLPLDQEAKHLLGAVKPGPALPLLVRDFLALLQIVLKLFFELRRECGIASRQVHFVV